MEIRRNIKKLINVAGKFGWKALIPRFQTLFDERRQENAYQKWVQNFETNDRLDLLKQISEFQHQPLISIILPVYDIDEKYLRLCIESVKDQIYQNWELCIADDCSPSPHIRRVLEEYRETDSRVKVIFRAENGHISAASNSALELANGEFCILLDHDDTLSETAVFYVVKELNDFPETKMIYSDEDLIDTRGRRYEPKFKPDFAHDLFYSENLVTHLSAFKTDLLRKIGGFTVGMEGSQDYDLTLRVIEQIPEIQIRHIPKILYHWRVIEGSVAAGGKEKPYAHLAARRAISAHLKRCGKNATVEPTIYDLHRVRYELPQELPKVSLILAADEDFEFSRTAVEKLIHQTDYQNLEIILICSAAFSERFRDASKDTETRLWRNVQFSTCSPKECEAEKYNSAVQKSTGELLCFFDINLRPLASDWLKEMVSFAIQTETGAVGAKLIHKNGTIMHGGLIIRKDGSVGVAHHGLPREKSGNISRAQVVGNFSAVSSSCLVTKRENFDKFGGFDAETFPRKLFDVDLCLKMLDGGLRNIFTPYAELMQIDELKLVNVQRNCKVQEQNELKRKWAKFSESDPFHSPNLT